MTKEQVAQMKPGAVTRRSMLRGLGFAPVFCVACPSIAQTNVTQLSAGQLIQRIKEHIGSSWSGPTVDTIKAGDPNTIVTGIATTFLDTYNVLERAARAGKNLIVTHEPTFYNHLDETKGLENDPVFLQKKTFIEKHKMVVWRFHDHWHARGAAPDGILEGMAAALGWKSYQDPHDPERFVLPETTLDALAGDIQRRLGIRALRVVGNPAMKVTQVGFVSGAAGRDHQIATLEKKNIEVLVAGEAREWETVEYARDAAAEGRRKGLILMGHEASEEAGMEYCAAWLKTFIPEVPIEFIKAGEPFWRPS
jgi:putative NIF3 family GTP cyclohydrolase 1 type 2